MRAWVSEETPERGEACIIAQRGPSGMIADPPVLSRVLFDIDQVLEMDRAGLLPSDRRVELVGGELYVLPSPGPAHISVVTSLQAMFSTLNAEKRLLVQQSLA